MGRAALAVLQCAFAEPDWGWPGNWGLLVGRLGQAAWCSTRYRADAAAADALHNFWSALLQDLGKSRCLLRSSQPRRGEPV